MREQTEATKTDQGWVDEVGMISPFKPGEGPRRYPTDEFPTGPAVGEKLLDIVLADQSGKLIDMHKARDGRPAIVTFFRSAVW